MSEQDEKGLDIPRKSVVLDGVWTDFYHCADVDPLLEAKDAEIARLQRECGAAQTQIDALRTKRLGGIAGAKSVADFEARIRDLEAEVEASSKLLSVSAEWIDPALAQAKRIAELEAKLAANDMAALRGAVASVKLAAAEEAIREMSQPDPDRLFPRDGSPLEVEIKPAPADPSELRARVKGLESVLANMVAFLNPQRAKLKGLRHSHMLMSALDAAEGLLGSDPVDAPVSRDRTPAEMCDHEWGWNFQPIGGPGVWRSCRKCNATLQVDGPAQPDPADPPVGRRELAAVLQSSGNIRAAMLACLEAGQDARGES